MIRRRKLLGLILAILLSGPVLAADDQPGILVLGGTRGVGLETVKLLLARGDAVTVLVRPTSDLTALNMTEATLVVGDALDRDSVDAAFASGEFRAVVSTLSGKGKDGKMADAEGNINGIDAAVAAGVNRFVLVSSIGVGDSKEALPWIARFMLRGFLEAKGRGEDHLFVSGLDYTIIRPGNLDNDDATGRGILTEDRSAGGSISRSEVARLVVEVLDQPAAFRKVYAAIEAE
ncbi:MAG: SDR family oxidoreductase [Gammaproteobacteria bacterium]|nr:SDR family oxidoreductase [Gammaproteobacteria bacterium]